MEFMKPLMHSIGYNIKEWLNGQQKIYLNFH